MLKRGKYALRKKMTRTRKHTRRRWHRHGLKRNESRERRQKMKLMESHLATNLMIVAMNRCAVIMGEQFRLRQEFVTEHAH